MSTGEIRLAILGPLRVELDGVAVELSRPKTRAVLLVLALHANRFVSTGYLSAALWDHAPPASAQANLRNYLTEIDRRLTTPGVGSPLVRRSGGALLRLDATELDLLAFQDRLRAARDRAGDRDLTGAAERYRAALALWRGAVAEGLLPGTALGHQLELVEQLRLDAIEEYAELRLDLGEHAGLADELREVVTRHPYRERAWAGLMVARYRAGQAAGALEAFREADRVLRSDLGVAPTPRLQELHAAVLRHDVALLAPPPRPVRAVPASGDPVPWQVPPVPHPFVGRAAEHASVAAVLSGPAVPGRGRIAVLHGLPGAGKSALAAAMAHANRASFPDGCLYANLNGADDHAPPAEPAEVIGRFLRALDDTGPVPVQLDEAAALLRSRLTGRRMLVLLDNAVSAAQVRPLLPACDSCAVIVTSRSVLPTLDATHIPVGKLPLDDAIALLAELVGPGRVAGDPDSVQRLAVACGQLPLALRIIGGRLATRPRWPLAWFAGRLEGEYGRLDELHADELDVRSSFSVSYASLVREPDPVAAATADLFCLLGRLDPADVTAEVAAVLLDDDTVAGRALDRLARDHLIEPSAPGRYAFHDLLRIFARELGAERVAPQRWAAVLERVLVWYAGLVADAVPLLLPRGPVGAPASRFADRAAAREWLDAERANLVAAVCRAERDAPAVARVTAQLGLDLGSFLNTWGYWAELHLVADATLSLADLTGDPCLRAAALAQRGIVDMRHGQTGEALVPLRRALSLYRALGDLVGQARALNNLALCHRRRGEYRLALGYLEEVIALRRRVDDRRGVGTALDNLGLVYQSMGEYARAAQAHEEGRQIARDLGDPMLEALVLLNLGETTRLTGRLDEATHLFGRAAELSRAAGNRAAETEALDQLARTLRARGKDREADRLEATDDEPDRLRDLQLLAHGHDRRR